MPPHLSPGHVGPALAGPAGASNGLFIGAKAPIRLPLATVNSAAASNTSATVLVKLVNPSRRLSCAFSVAFEAATQQTPDSYNSAVWTPRAMRPGDREAQLHTLESGIALPRMYELDSAIRLVLITCTLKVPVTAAPAAINGQWVFQADWEPNTPICEEEILDLYSKCSATVMGAPPAALNL